MSKSMSKKPKKPRADFPLTPHNNGRWCKRIRGRLHYFGRWDDPDGALVEYLDQKDDLYAGRVPRRSQNALDLAFALDHFLSSKKADLQEGRIVPRTYWELDRTCERISTSARSRTPWSSFGGCRLSRSTLVYGCPSQVGQPGYPKGVEPLPPGDHGCAAVPEPGVQRPLHYGHHINQQLDQDLNPELHVRTVA